MLSHRISSTANKRRSRKRSHADEGVALGRALPGQPVMWPLPHAWAIDADDRVIDPTWAGGPGLGLAYFGVVL